MAIRRQERHRSLHGRCGQHQRRLPGIHAVHTLHVGPRKRTPHPHIRHPAALMVLQTPTSSNPLHTKDSIMNLLADRETTAARDDSSQILVTPATDNENNIVTTPLQPALVQHASTDTETAQPKSTSTKPRQARIPIPTPSSLRRNPTTRTKTTFYKPHDIRNVTAAIRKIINIDSPPPLDRDATTFLGLNLLHNADNNVTVTQPKLLTKLFALHPPRKEGPITAQPKHPYPPLPKDTDTS